MSSSEAKRDSVDAGLALLRIAAGLSIFLFFGLTKIKAATAFTFAHRPWPFIDFNREVGLPFPLLSAYLQTINESVCALAVASGVLTRVAAGCMAAGFGAASICSLRAAEPVWPLTAAYLSLIFASLTITGGGRFTVSNLVRQRIRRTAVVIFVMMISVAGRGQSPCHVGVPPDEQKSFPIEIISNKPFVQVRINDSKPHRFMLDTGSGAALIDPHLAQSLGFEPASENKGFFGVGTAKSSLTLLKPLACQEMGGAKAADVHLLAFDLSMISSVEGVPVLGTVGGEFLSRYVIVIDYANARLRVFDRTFDYHGNGIVLPATIDRQIFVTARIHKNSGEVVEGKFYLDTGTRSAISFNSPFVKNNQLLNGETAIPLATLGVGMGGESLASVYRVREIEIGPIQIRDVVATASLDEQGVFADPKIAGIIGGELLRKFTLILDYPHQRVILEKSSQSDTPFGYDSSGLFLVAEGTKLERIKVLRVIPGSPADHAGLQKNDVILWIDGRRATNLEHVRQSFRLLGRTYPLRVRRRGKTLSMSIRTEDLLASPTATRRM